MNHEERIKGYFNSHPQINKLFVSSDGAAFFSKENAESYAQIFKTPEGKEVKEVTRAELFKTAKTGTNNPDLPDEAEVPEENEPTEPVKKAPAKKTTKK